MGYTYHSGEENQLNALIFSQERKVDLAKKQTNRTVYRCHVIGTYIKSAKIFRLPKKNNLKLIFFSFFLGPRDAGKTTFCQGLLGRSLQDIESIKQEDLPRHIINSVQVYGQEKVSTNLLLKNVPK